MPYSFFAHIIKKMFVLSIVSCFLYQGIPVNPVVFRSYILFITCFLACPVWASVSGTTLAGLMLDVSNIQSSTGSLRIALYSSDGVADWHTEPFRVVEISPVIAGDVVHYAIEALPPGGYAIRLFHDVNSNKILDLSESGLPVEPFAISRGPGKKQQSLLFRDAVIQVDLPEQHLMLNLISIKQ